MLNMKVKKSVALHLYGHIILFRDTFISCSLSHLNLSAKNQGQNKNLLEFSDDVL